MTTILPRADKAALDALTELNANYAWPRLQESLFVNKYLPILTYNLVRPVEEHIKDIKTEIWVREVSTNPYYSVLVVDPQDQVLFWVPPILRTGSIFHQKSGMDSFNEVIANAANHESVMPGAGRFRLNAEVEARLKGNVNLSMDQKQWYLILAHYGILEKIVGLEGVVLPTIATAPLSSDEIIWGEVDEL